MEPVNESITTPSPITQSAESHEVLKKQPLDALIVAGMGPVQLSGYTINSKEPLTASPFARRNSQAAKLVAARNLTKEVYMSGFASNKNIPLTEAEVQGKTYSRMVPTNLPPEQRQAAIQAAENAFVLEPDAETTFANIFRSLNLLDAQNNGHFDGEFGVLSFEEHLPRIQEMLKAFGLTTGKVLSADKVLVHYGYTNIYPKQVELADGNKISYEQFDTENLRNQPGGLENLQDNPSYVTKELQKITSNKRLWEVASSVKRYYEGKNISLPVCYNNLPNSYNEAFDFDTLRNQFAAIPFTKHPPTEKALTPAEYKRLSEVYGKSTQQFLEEHDPNPPQVVRNEV